MATIKDIARLAGVSQGTVSNVLNGRNIVSSDKIARVMKAVEESGYVLNEKAHFLRKGTAKVLGVILPDLHDRFYLDFFASFKQYAEKMSYSVELFLTHDDAEQEKEAAGRLRSRMVEGVAVFTAVTDGSQPYKEAGFSDDNVIFVTRRPSYDCQYLGFDYEKAGREMARVSADKKYTQAALMSETLSRFEKREFRDAFVKAMGELSPRCEIIESVTGRSGRYQNVIQLFTGVSAPQAVFTENYSLASVVHTVHKNFFHRQPLDIYTLSPQYSMPEDDFIKYEMDARLLGRMSAEYLIEKPGTGFGERVLEAKGFSTWPSGVTVSTGKTLMIATISSPTMRAIQSMVNLYEDYSGVKVRLVELSGNTLYNRLDNWGDTSSYDIVRLDVNWFPWFAKKIFEPLGNIDPAVQRKMSGFLPNVVKKYSEVDGEIYAFPGTSCVQLLFYRKDLFDNSQLKRQYYEKTKKELAPPETFEEFNRIAEFFTASLNPDSPVKYGCTLVAGDADLAGMEFLLRYFSHTQNLFDEKGQILADREAARKAMLEVLEAKRCSAPALRSWWLEAAQDFAGGEAAMTIQFINHVSDFMGPDSVVSDRIGWAMVPGGNPMLGGSVLGISKYSRQKKESLDFLKWISRDDIATANILLGGMSARSASYENSEVIADYPWIPFARECFGRSHTNYYPENGGEAFEIRKLQTVLGVAVTEVLSQSMSIDQAIELAVTSL